MILVLLLSVLKGVIFAETVGNVDLEDTFPEITHSVLPHLKKDLHVRQFQLPVFNSKYKLRKNMSKNRLSAFSMNILILYQHFLYLSYQDDARPFLAGIYTCQKSPF
jgi:hypothetical protein